MFIQKRYEVQVLDNNNDTDVNGQVGAIYKQSIPLAITSSPTGEWIGRPKYIAHGKAPISLQDHGDNSRVSFRNIWVRELD